MALKTTTKQQQPCFSVDSAWAIWASFRVRFEIPGGRNDTFYLNSTLPPPEWFRIETDSSVSHFNVSVTVRKKSNETMSINVHNVHKAQTVERKESRNRMIWFNVVLRPQKPWVGLIIDGEPRTATSTFTQPLSSELNEIVSKHGA